MSAGITPAQKLCPEPVSAEPISGGGDSDTTLVVEGKEVSKNELMDASTSEGTASSFGSARIAHLRRPRAPIRRDVQAEFKENRREILRMQSSASDISRTDSNWCPRSEASLRRIISDPNGALGQLQERQSERSFLRRKSSNILRDETSKDDATINTVDDCTEPRETIESAPFTTVDVLNLFAELNNPSGRSFSDDCNNKALNERPFRRNPYSIMSEKRSRGRNPKSSPMETLAQSRGVMKTMKKSVKEIPVTVAPDDISSSYVPETKRRRKRSPPREHNPRTLPERRRSRSPSENKPSSCAPETPRTRRRAPSLREHKPSPCAPKTPAKRKRSSSLPQRKDSSSPPQRKPSSRGRPPKRKDSSSPPQRKASSRGRPPKRKASSSPPQRKPSSRGPTTAPKLRRSLALHRRKVSARKPKLTVKSLAKRKRIVRSRV